MLPRSSSWHISVMSGSKWGNTGIFGNSRTRPSTNLTVLGAARRKLTASVWLMLVTSMSLTCNNKNNTGVLVRSQARQNYWGSIYCCSQVLLKALSEGPCLCPLTTFDLAYDTVHLFFLFLLKVVPFMQSLHMTTLILSLLWVCLQAGVSHHFWQDPERCHECSSQHCRYLWSL